MNKIFSCLRIADQCKVLNSVVFYCLRAVKYPRCGGYSVLCSDLPSEGGTI